MCHSLSLSPQKTSSWQLVSNFIRLWGQSTSCWHAQCGKWANHDHLPSIVMQDAASNVICGSSKSNVQSTCQLCPFYDVDWKILKVSPPFWHENFPHFFLEGIWVRQHLLSAGNFEESVHSGPPPELMFSSFLARKFQHFFLQGIWDRQHLLSAENIEESVHTWVTSLTVDDTNCGTTSMALGSTRKPGAGVEYFGDLRAR